AACSAGVIQFWHVFTGKDRGVVRLADTNDPNKGQAPFVQLQLSLDGKHVASLERTFGTAGASTRLAFWETARGKPLFQHLLPGEGGNCAWRPDGKAAAVSLGNGLALLDVETGRDHFSTPTRRAGPVVASPDYRLLAACLPPATRAQGDPDTVGVWETATG